MLMAENEVNLVLILTGVILSILNTFLPHLLKPILSLLNKSNDSVSNQLKKEVSNIKLELSQISVIDEFAKHARLQRKLNVLQGQLMDEVKSQMSNSVKTRLLITYTIQILLGLTCALVLWQYRSEPVIVLPPQWLYPVGFLLSWPTSTPGAISFAVWLVTTNVTCKTALGYCK